MAATDEHVPSPELIEAIMRDTVIPRIDALADESGLPRTVLGLVRVRGSDVEQFGESNGFWKVRLITRHTFREDREVFRVQALISGQHQSGFRGFQLSGEALMKGNTIQAVQKGWTGLYNTDGNADWS